MEQGLGRLRLERPLVILDLEATGLDITFERIVEIAVLRVSPNGHREEFHTYVNPEMSIPVEATQVHRIDDQMVAGAPTFAEIADRVFDMLVGADLAGFNHVRFDLPLLREEFRRARIDWDWGGVRLLDAQAIYHKMEPRDLSAAYRFYCRRELEGAHGALADTRATLEVLVAQLDHYPQLPADVADLDEQFGRRDDRFVDRERRFFWRDGEPSFNFGDHKGKSLREVADEFPDYLDWILRKNFSDEVKAICQDALRGTIRKRSDGKS
ncbi:MAG: 3'-5' exonuclease [Candidatus Eisenbacteria bacterium]